jgi:hypothetical protein
MMTTQVVSQRSTNTNQKREDVVLGCEKRPIKLVSTQPGPSGLMITVNRTRTEGRAGEDTTSGYILGKCLHLQSNNVVYS